MAFILLFLTNRLFLPSVSLLLSPAAFSSPSFYFHFDVWMYSIVNRAFHVSPRLTFIILLVMILLLLLLLRERERERGRDADVRTQTDQRTRQEMEGLSWQQQSWSGRALHLRML